MFNVQASTVGPTQLTLYGSGDEPKAGDQVAYLAADGPAQTEVLSVSRCPQGVWMGPLRVHVARSAAQPLPGQQLRITPAGDAPVINSPIAV